MKALNKYLIFASLATLLSCSDEPIEQDSTPKNIGISAPAELISLDEVTLGPPNIRQMWQYKIEYLARENAIVKKGDVIARFDGQRLKDEFITRDSQLAAAKKEAEKQQLIDEATQQDLELALAEAKKDEEIARRKVEITDVSRSEIEKQKQVAEFKIATEVLKQAIQRLAQHANAVEARKKVQEAKIQNRQSRVDEINASLAKLELKAPKPGIVLYIPDGNDDKPAVGDTVYMGRTLLKIPSLDKIAAQAEFDESYISKVAVGQQVKVTLDAFPERSFQGVIEDLGKAFRQKSQRNPKIVFDAYISIDELDIDIMRPGMKATIALANTQDEVGK